MRRPTHRRTTRHSAADRPAEIASSDRAAEVFVTAVSGLSALVDGAWLAAGPPSRELTPAT